MALAALAKEPAGARFRLADLQLHTPRDKRFKPGAAVATPEERRAFARRYVEAAASKGLEVIAITEHNDVTWVEPIRSAALEAGLLMFPGFEVASSEGVHVLCLFEPDANVRHVDEILVALGLPTANRFHADGSPRVSAQTLLELVDKVQGGGGLCILAHVDSDDGILNRLDGEPRVLAWVRCSALAVQCSQDPLDMGPTFNRRLLLNEADLDIYLRDRAYACIQTSDARDLNEIGSKPTYIKMSSESLAGLRQAFLDPESRVGFPGRHLERPVPKLLSARWDGAFIDEGLPLNPNLNCLVGGKGTGKSTVVETIRYLFDLPIPTPDVEEQAHRLLDETFPTSAKLSVLIEVAIPKPKRYVIERIGRDQPIVRDAASGELIPGLRPSDLFRPVVFGQKEIYETAQRIETQLKLLDAYCAEQLRPLQTAERDEVTRTKAVSDRIRLLSGRAVAIEERLNELPTLRERKRVFDEAGLASALGDQARLQQENEFWTATEERLDSLDMGIDALRDTPQSARELPDIDGMANESILQRAKQGVEALDGEFATAADSLANSLKGVRSQLETIRQEWTSAYATRLEELRAAVRPLEEEYGAKAVKEYLQLGPRIEELEREDGQLRSLRTEIAELSNRRVGLLAQVRELRRQIFRIRENEAVQLSAGLEGAVRVTVEHQGDRRAVVRTLKDWKTGTVQAHLQQMVDRPDFSPARLAELIRLGAAEVAGEYGLSLAAAQKFTSGSAERIDMFELHPIDDKVEVALNVAAEGPAHYRPLERLSAGQRSTAILLLALLQGNEPLLLDQPEDDLDNRFIYTDVVRRLRRAKEERQFIIATHNANIPVLGDAEHIVVLEAIAAQGQVHARVAVRGSIDDEALRGPLEDVLEGGREAFQLRKQKYGF